VDAEDRTSAEHVRSLLSRGAGSPAEFRAALTRVRVAARDAWLDHVFGLDELPADDPALPRGCVPYLPCPVDAVLRAVDHAGVTASDVFVDVGSGVGRASALVHLLTQAAVIGVEIQPALVRASRELMARLHLGRFFALEGDAAQLTRLLTIGTVFFFYCPFGGDRLARVLDDLEAMACARELRLCCVDLPLPPRPWLTRVSPPSRDLAVYRSTRPPTAQARTAGRPGRGSGPCHRRRPR
jgi:predicted RNA methylase